MDIIDTGADADTWLSIFSGTVILGDLVPGHHYNMELVNKRGTSLRVTVTVDDCIQNKIALYNINPSMRRLEVFLEGLECSIPQEYCQDVVAVLHLINRDHAEAYGRGLQAMVQGTNKNAKVRVNTLSVLVCALTYLHAYLLTPTTLHKPCAPSMNTRHHRCPLPSLCLKRTLLGAQIQK